VTAKEMGFASLYPFYVEAYETDKARIER
jgi:hypothetical protein